MAVSLGTFFGGGYDVGAMTGDVQLPTGCGRVVVISSLNAGGHALQLPFKFIPSIRRKGAFHFLIINDDTFSSVNIANFGQTAAKYTLSADRAVFVGLDHNNNWIFTEQFAFQSN